MDILPSRRDKASNKITEDLIEILTNNSDLDQIVSLSFNRCYAYIRRIENLDKCISLQYLNLSYNLITRIENLNNLTKLRVLNLSENNIKVISNIGHLCQLQTLNLSGNEISKIPQEQFQNLRNLSSLRISRNNITQLEEYKNLAYTSNLSELWAEENPTSQNYEYRRYICSVLIQLHMLDGQVIKSIPQDSIHQQKMISTKNTQQIQYKSFQTHSQDNQQYTSNDVQKQAQFSIDLNKERELEQIEIEIQQKENVQSSQLFSNQFENLSQQSSLIQDSPQKLQVQEQRFENLNESSISRIAYSPDRNTHLKKDFISIPLFEYQALSNSIQQLADFLGIKCLDFNEFIDKRDIFQQKLSVILDQPIRFKRSKQKFLQMYKTNTQQLQEQYDQLSKEQNLLNLAYDKFKHENEAHEIQKEHHDELKAEVQKLINKKQQLIQENKQLQLQIQERSHNLSQISIDKSAMQSQAEKYSMLFQDEENKYNQIINETHSIQNTIDQLSDTKFQLNKSISSLKQDKQKLEMNIMKLEKIQSKNQMEIDKQRELIQYERSILEEQNEQMQATINNKEQKIFKLKDELYQIRVDIKDSQDKMFNLNSEMQKKISLKQQTEFQQQQSQIKLDNLILNLTKAEETLQQIQEQIDSHQKQFNQQKVVLSNLDEEIQLKQAIFEEIGVQQKKTESIITQTEDKYRRLLEQIEISKEEQQQATQGSYINRSKLQDITQRLQKSEDQFYKLQDKIKLQSQEFQIENRKLAEIQKEIVYKTKDLESLKQEQISIDNKIIESEEIYRELIKEIQISREEKQLTIQEIHKNKDKLQGIVIRLQKAENKILNLHSEIENHSQQFSIQSQRLVELKQEIVYKNDNLQNLEEQQKELFYQSNHEKERLNKTKQELQQIENTIQQKNDQIFQLDRLIMKNEVTLQDLKDKARQQQNIIDLQQRDLSQVSDQKSKQDSHIQALNQEINYLTQTVQNMKESLAEVQQIKYSAIQEIEDIRRFITQDEERHQSKLTFLRKSLSDGEIALREVYEMLTRYRDEAITQKQKSELLQNETQQLELDREIAQRNLEEIKIHERKQRSELQQLKDDTDTALVLMALSGHKVDEKLKIKIRSLLSAHQQNQLLLAENKKLQERLNFRRTEILENTIIDDPALIQSTTMNRQSDIEQMKELWENLENVQKQLYEASNQEVAISENFDI